MSGKRFIYDEKKQEVVEVPRVEEMDPHDFECLLRRIQVEYEQECRDQHPGTWL